jgi:NDP-sugar pyrophosphorylase family protein
MIEDYFGDGAAWGVNIRYIHETKRMGTAGSLTLLPDTPSKPFIVMNGDLLTKVNFEQLLEFHNENNSMATMCVREYEYQVPYGVVQTDKHRITSIVEKPIHLYYVNAGIYALNPEALQCIPRDTFFDMPMLFDKFITLGHETAVFPIREYWLDIGRIDDFTKANLEFMEVFG